MAKALSVMQWWRNGSCVLIPGRILSFGIPGPSFEHHHTDTHETDITGHVSGQDHNSTSRRAGFWQLGAASGPQGTQRSGTAVFVDDG
jgi:hypothetical protein